MLSYIYIVYFYISDWSITFQAIGAVNTIVKRQTDGKLVGYNTDYVGALSAIEDGMRGDLYLFTTSKW